MRVAFLLVAVFLCSGISRAQTVIPYLFAGDPLTPKERAVITERLGTPTSSLTVVVRKADVDGDSQVDIVALVSGQLLTVLLRRGASFQEHSTRFRAVTVAMESQLDVVSGLNGRKEILAKVGDACFIAYMSEELMRASGTPLEYEHFECKDSQAHARFSAARSQCLGEGGTWGPQGMLRHGLCVRQMADAGKSCASAAECLGKCVYTGPPVPLGAPVEGKCTRSDVGFGCLNLVRDGKYSGRLCAD